MTVPTIVALEDLEARLDWDLDADEQRIAASALYDACAAACWYGNSSWTAATAPHMVAVLILGAVASFMRNPDGYTQSRAGDEMVAWAENNRRPGAFSFTDDEIALLKQLAGRPSGLSSAPISAWGSTYPARRPSEGYVPVSGSGSGFPMFSSDTSPW